MEVTVRLDVRLPALGAARKAHQVPSLEGNYAYKDHDGSSRYQGVGQSWGRQAAEPVSQQERFSKLHCGRCI